MSGLTPFQTLGPFFDFGLVISEGDVVAKPESTGRHIAIEGTVRVVGKGTPGRWWVWQPTLRANAGIADKRIGADPAFDGFGRVATNEAGSLPSGRSFPAGADRMTAARILRSVSRAEC